MPVALQAVLAAARTWDETRSVSHWVLGGHSMGARAAVSTAAEGPEGVSGCLLLSYPVHPPGKPVSRVLCWSTLKSSAMPRAGYNICRSQTLLGQVQQPQQAHKA
jgi:predicted alpha/beta-hydrolase family hydrolase